MDEINKIRLIIESLKDRLPSDCSYLIDQVFKEFLKDVRRIGLERAIKKWYNGEIFEEEVEVI